MNDTYKWVLEAENESLREQVKELKKKIKQTIDTACSSLDTELMTNTNLPVEQIVLIEERFRNAIMK